MTMTRNPPSKKNNIIDKNKIGNYEGPKPYRPLNHKAPYMKRVCVKFKATKAYHRR